MPPKTRAAQRPPSPGALYRDIEVGKDYFEKGETRLLKPVQPGFVQFCKRAYGIFPSPAGAKFSPKHSDAIAFLGWELKPEELNSGIAFTAVVAFSVALLAGLALVFIPNPLNSFLSGMIPEPAMVMLYLFLPFVLGAAYAVYFVMQYPINAAGSEKLRALTYVPEIIGYMIMSMKLVPNLEKAVEFAASHGKGKIAEDLKKLLWDVQLGVYNTLAEGLDALAYRWGKFSDEFKRALMMIRASVLEDTEAKRYALLDKTMAEMLESIKIKMENYARSLSQPTMVLFYIGVLLPLILIIILPVGSAFSGAAMARREILIFIYNILIPFITFVFAFKVIQQRPPTYEPPMISEKYPGLPPKNKMVVGKITMDTRFVIAVVLIAGIAASFFIHYNGLPPNPPDAQSPFYLLPPDRTEEYVLKLDTKDPNYFGFPSGTMADGLRKQNLSEDQIQKSVLAEKIKFFSQPKNDTTPYNLIIGIILTLSVAAFIHLYFANIYKRNMQQEIMRMETEFKDSLYIIASRMGENKPVEDALAHTRTFLPNSLIGERIFGRTVENISLLGMPLQQAVFDPTYGSLRDVPSAIIHTSMKLLVDSVSLGVNVAARTLISLSMQLSNSEKVTRMLTILVQDITSMMQTVSLFIAPVVLGVTTALQKVVMVTLTGIVQGGGQEAVSGAGGLSATSLPPGVELPGGLQNIVSGGGSAFGSVSPDVIAQMVTPAEFLIIIALYVIEVVIIMTYFTTKVEEDNPVLIRVNIAKAIPISMVVFLVAVIVSNLMIGSYMSAQ